MKKIIRIRNLDCANCAAELSEELMEIEGVAEASADFINQRVTLDCTPEALDRCIDCISHFEEVEIVDANAPKKRERHCKEILSVSLSALFFVPALVLQIMDVNTWLCFSLFLASALSAGWIVLWNVVLSVPRMFRDGFHPSVLLDENFLMTVAAVGAFAIGENLEGAAVMLLYEIGELLQSIAVGSSRGAIEKLMQLQSDTAVRITEEGTEEIDPSLLCAGDRILLRRGDRVPADCRIFEGETSFDTKSLTGEAYFREAGVGAEILAGCVNEGGAVKAEVLRPVSESAVSRILDLVENAASKKAKPEKFITRFARIYTPVVVFSALLLAVLPPLWNAFDFPTWIGRALNFLVISCPCALIISVPLTYFSGVGALARAGVLAKGAAHLDLLAAVKVAAFDKTGTLTEGKFRISSVTGGDEVLKLAASLEAMSTHPLAEAFAGLEAYTAQSCEEIAGMGISGVVKGKHILVGSARLMRERGVEADERTGADLILYVAEEGQLIGTISITDAVRPEAKETLVALKESGIGRIAVLTGDTALRAETMLKELPVDEVRAALLPEEKPKAAEALKAYGPLLYVGDGINDTPVMAASDVAVAMGGLGSDAAIEASDFVLAGDNLSALPKALKGAKKTRRIVTENIVGSIVLKVVLMALSLFGLIPLWAAVFGDVGVMLLAVLNSMRMRCSL